MIEFFGYLVGLIVGIILGLLGGGGSLLAIPMFWVFDQPYDLGSAYITILVGATALFGLMPRIRQKEVDWSTVVALGIPVSIGMLLVRLWLIDIVPDIRIGSIEISKKDFVLLIVAGLLLLSFASMIGLIGKNFKTKTNWRAESPASYYLTLTICGLLIGIGPGFSGAGGGVLIVPLLVVFFGIEMKTVVGTTLAIVSMKSFVGFFGGDLIKQGAEIDVTFLLLMLAIMVVGVLLGSAISRRIEADKLKRGFGWFLLGLAIFIIFNAFLGDKKEAPNSADEKRAVSMAISNP